MESIKEEQNKYKKVSCPNCSSADTIKWCKRKTQNRGLIQRYKCKSCNSYFSIDDGFYRMKKPKHLITSCLDLYFNGMSLRSIRQHIRQFTPEGVSHMSVWRWLIKYSKRIRNFTYTLQPTLSGIYHADEIFVSCRGQQNYFWDMVDRDTRYLVSSYYSDKRDSKSAKMLFLKAKHRPLTLFTDGLQGYRKAYRKVWGTKTRKQDKQTYIRLKADIDKRNNIVERIQGTIRERIKVMRSFKNKESAEMILNLFVVYYNFIRIHQGINKTPIEQAGVNLNLGKNKWLDLIYNANQN